MNMHSILPNDSQATEPIARRALPGASVNSAVTSSDTSAKASASQPAANSAAENGKLREVFDDFVGRTFYGQMLSAMRKTVDKPAYFHGGHAEEMFQAQLDQTLAERLADGTAEQFTGPMFELFNLQRQ
jgi:hypothetical protein